MPTEGQPIVNYAFVFELVAKALTFFGATLAFLSGFVDESGKSDAREKDQPEKDQPEKDQPEKDQPETDHGLFFSTKLLLSITGVSGLSVLVLGWASSAARDHAAAMIIFDLVCGLLAIVVAGTFYKGDLAIRKKPTIPRPNEKVVFILLAVGLYLVWFGALIDVIAFIIKHSQTAIV